MTTTTAPATRGLIRKRPQWLTTVIVAALLAAVAMVVTLLTSGQQGNTGDLDPANPGSSGAQGLATVLRDHGVGVTIVRSQRELLAAAVDGGTTVAITGTDRLSGRTAQAALAHAATAASLVLLRPDTDVTKGMGLPVDSHPASLTGVAAGCRSAAVGADFRLARADRAYTLTAAGSTATTCFPDRDDGGAAMVSLPAGTGRPPVILLGDQGLITNGAILNLDNAAIALHLFGRSDRLIWYVPTLADVSASDSTSRSIAPVWFQPGIALAASGVVLLCFWRGRRLGRLVTEPLPVIVRAVETTESRGRMYRRARDRTRALTVLQMATRKRLAAYLGLPASSAISSVAAAAAAVSGRTYQEVLDLLTSPAAPDDSSLLTRANTLTALEKEVRRI